MHAVNINCCALQVGEEGKVVGIDHIEGLVNDSVKNMKKKDGELLDKKIVDLVGMIFFMLVLFCLHIFFKV